MQNSLLWPYDEVRVDESDTGVFLKAPWIEVSFDKTTENTEELTRLVQALSNPNLSLEGAQLVTEYFEPLEEHYLCYTLPTPLPSGLDEHLSQSEVHDLSPQTFFATAVCASTQLSETEKAEILKRWEGTQYQWSWDADAALGFASLGEKIHPQSLFSVARRYHLLSLMENDPGSSVFSKMAALPATEFKSAAALVLRQNHYVTRRCESALSPAQTIAGQAEPRVKAFMEEERGHDRILALGLESLGTKPELVPVADITRILMCLLEFAARKNFLAFAIAIDFFERRIYDRVEPLAVLLEQRGFPEAAKRLSAHKNINDAGEHHCAGRDLLEFMAACDPGYAREALKIAEAISFAMSQVVRSAYALSRH